MVGRILRLHLALPEGWEDSTRVGVQEWIRTHGSTLLRVRHDAVDQEYVAWLVYVGDQGSDSRFISRHTSLTMAIAACERAYCGCYVGASVACSTVSTEGA